MSRLPSRRHLELMSSQDRWQDLQQLADDIRTEHADVLSGNIKPWGKTNRQKLLTSARRRLHRVYAAADNFGCHVGQPDSSLGETA